MPTSDTALPGRAERLSVPPVHFVNGNPMSGPFPSQLQQAIFGMGCFWGVERIFWQLDGVYTTAAGYAAGVTPNPTYQEVCSGLTGHNEVVRVVFDPALVSYERLLRTFWEGHNPTQGMRQGNDKGTQYRSGIYTYDDEQAQQARTSFERFQSALEAAGFSAMVHLGNRLGVTKFPSTLPIGSGNEDNTYLNWHFYPESEAQILAETSGAIGLEVSTNAVAEGNP